MVVGGKFLYVREEGFKDFLIKEGVPADRVEAMSTTGNNVYDIKVDGSKVVVSHTMGDGPARVSEFIVGQEVTQKMGDRTLKSTATLEGNDVKIESVGEKGQKRTMIYKFSDSGLEVLHISDKGRGKIIYKRA